MEKALARDLFAAAGATAFWFVHLLSLIYLASRRRPKMIDRLADPRGYHEEFKEITRSLAPIMRVTVPTVMVITGAWIAGTASRWLFVLTIFLVCLAVVPVLSSGGRVTPWTWFQNVLWLALGVGATALIRWATGI
jgi:hypothetical protein